MALLTDDWGYPVAMSELDPNDPVVNTASEYMFQMATINYHTLHGTQTVVITEDTEFNGEVFKAGTYEFPVDGRYWTGFDREHPIEAIGPRAGLDRHSACTHRRARRGHGHRLRPAPWPGLAALFAGVGATFLLTGAGLVWAVRPATAKVPVLKTAAVPA